MSRPSDVRHESLVGRRMLAEDFRPDPGQGAPRSALSSLRTETHARVSAQAQLRDDAAMDRPAEDLRGLQAAVEARRLRRQDFRTVLWTVLALAAIVLAVLATTPRLVPIAVRAFAPEAPR